MSAFIAPSALRQNPPTGPGWIHEVKFDGWRVQLQKDGQDVAIVSRIGSDFTRRFPMIGGAICFAGLRSSTLS